MKQTIPIDSYPSTAGRCRRCCCCYCCYCRYRGILFIAVVCLVLCVLLNRIKSNFINIHNALNIFLFNFNTRDRHVYWTSRMLSRFLIPTIFSIARNFPPFPYVSICCERNWKPILRFFVLLTFPCYVFYSCLGPHSLTNCGNVWPCSCLDPLPAGPYWFCPNVKCASAVPRQDQG